MYIRAMDGGNRAEKRTENITIKVSEALKDEIQAIAAKEDRTVSQTSYLLLRRGLIGFRADQNLSSREVAVISLPRNRREFVEFSLGRMREKRESASGDRARVLDHGILLMEEELAELNGEVQELAKKRA